MKYLMIFALLLFSQLCNAVTISWSSPTKRENGAVLTLQEICCYEMRGRDILGKVIWEVKIQAKLVDKYNYTFMLPAGFNVKTYEIAAIDTNGLYSRFVDVVPIKPLLAPTDGEIF